MKIFVSIDGVLRNTIQKFDYHYKDYFLNTDIEDGEETFEYGVSLPILNDNIIASYKFQSEEELKNFVYIEFPIEIFGHAGISYPHAITEVNKLIHENKDHNFTFIGLDEFAKAKPATLFFLSKNGFMGNTVIFRSSTDIDELWKECDVWITDNKKIIDACPKGKRAIKFNTDYNKHFTNREEINKLSEIELKCQHSTKKTITSTLTACCLSVKQTISRKLRTLKTPLKKLKLRR